MGDGVNIAARLEGIAEPGAFVFPGRLPPVRDCIKEAFVDLGERELKNITRLRSAGGMSTRVPQSWCGRTSDEAGHGTKSEDVSIASGDWNGRSHGEQGRRCAGGASGIGRATAVAFAREGARVVIGDVDAAGAEKTPSALLALQGWSLTSLDMVETLYGIGYRFKEV
jgi:hypothetical protein